jgi:hypothetical protein
MLDAVPGVGIILLPAAEEFTTWVVCWGFCTIRLATCCNRCSRVE